MNSNKIAIRRGYADTSIGQLHYRRAGTGGVLVLLHHTAASSEHYEPLMRLLAPRFDLVAIDTPGFGMSVSFTRMHSLEEYARVIVEALENIGVGSFSIFGHHTGAAIACEVASLHAKKVRKTILSSPPFDDVAGAQERLKRLKAKAWRITADGSHFAGKWRNLTSLAETTGDLTPELKHRETLWELLAGPGYIYTYEAVFTYDWPSRVPKIATPTLVLSGEHDPHVHSVKPTALLLQEGTVKVIPRANLWVLIQQPQVVAEAVSKFLRDPLP